MLNLRLLVVGKLKESWWQEAEAEFLKRLAPFAKLKIEEVEPEAITPSVSAELSVSREGERLLRRLSQDETVFALDRTGRGIDSPALAKLLTDESVGGRLLTFVIGGAAGLSEAVLHRADRKLSLSALTFTHEMARVILTEQLYRAATISAGKKYHL